MGTQDPLCQFSDRPQEVINAADFIVHFNHERHEHFTKPSVELLCLFLNLKESQLATLSHIVLLPFGAEHSIHGSTECGNSNHETHRIFVEFLIINLLKKFNQGISRREGFGEFHNERKKEWGRGRIRLSPRIQYGREGGGTQAVGCQFAKWHRGTLQGRWLPYDGFTIG